MEHARTASRGHAIQVEETEVRRQERDIDVETLNDHQDGLSWEERRRGKILFSRFTRAEGRHIQGEPRTRKVDCKLFKLIDPEKQRRRPNLKNKGL